MLRNYLKIALRSIWKNKGFSLINILGLSIGLSAAFVIGAMVYYDLTFDTFHPDRDRIFRVTSSFTGPGTVFYNSGITVPLAQELEGLNSGELETVAPFFTTDPLRVSNPEANSEFKNPEFVIYTGSQFFQTFDYEWLAGNSSTALAEPNTVVLSENRAKKYFPGQNVATVLGRSIVYNDTITTTVAGVVANFKNRTDLVFEEFISLKTAETQDMTGSVQETSWNNTNSASQLFIKISKNTDPSGVQHTLTQIAKAHDDPEMVAEGRTNTYVLQPLADLHLNPYLGKFDFSESQTTKAALNGLVMLALILVLLGCINFINLNTAQALQRAKEIGIRKTLGSSKVQLIAQFLGETLLLTLTAAALSVFISKWLLLLFADFIPIGLTFDIFYNPIVLLGVVVLLLLVTFLSGFYPALIMSKFRPISVLKQQVVPNSNKGTLRKFLTVSQFVIAQVFIIATLIVGKQLNYIMNKDMGFDTKALTYVRTPWNDDSLDKRVRFETEVAKLTGISKTALAGNPPASFGTISRGVLFIDGDREVNSDLQLLFGDRDFFELYNLNLVTGRLPLNDSINEFVVNRAYLKVLGIDDPEAILGKTLKSNNMDIPIVGVMDDFNQFSLKYEIHPMAFTGNVSQFRTLHFKLNNAELSNWNNTLAQIETVWKKIYPDADFEYTFMDDTIKRFYEAEQKTALLLKWATGLAILISCLGLFGLVVHTTERRTKEIGVRKILGASLIQLNVLLSKEFLKLVFIAFLIAAPIAWYGLDYWLEGFANKTNLSWWIFVLSGLLMVGIALLIMSIKTIASANVNPVKSLRTE